MRKILILIFLLSATVLFSQVGIQTLTPSPLTELDIKNKIVAGDTIPKGILIPRMTLKQRNAINVTDIKAANSLLIYNTDEDCYNYYNRTAGEWSSLCGKLGKAQFGPVDCGTVSVTGQYLTKTALSSQNYITVTVNVTKPGSYVIKAMPTPDNGYYFYTSGEFLQIGTFVVTVPAAGTPQNKKDPDLISIEINDIEVCSGIKIVVEDSSIKPNYTMDCSSVSVKGVYKVNTPVTSANYITITLNVSPAAFGSTFIIKTNTVDGLSFSGTSMIISNPQIVRLDASGTPTSLSEKVFTITSNSSSSVATCSAKVTVALTPKKIVAIGDGSIYGYNASTINSYVNKMMTTPANFGTLETSTVKVEGITITNGFQPNRDQLKALLDNRPDIVIIGYNWYMYDTESAQYLADYLAKGGVVIAYIETAGAFTRRFFQTIFGDEGVTITGSNGGGAVYKFPYTNDEVINGVFGDLRGLQWGEDASATLSVGNIPANSVTVYSTDSNVSTGTPAAGTRVTAFRHNSLNLIFVGDGGFNSGTAVVPTTAWPFKVDLTTFKPIPTSGYGAGTPKFTVYNSIFTANALAWALKRAEFNGINSVTR